jgi:tRNA dimethylallyltransferase
LTTRTNSNGRIVFLFGPTAVGKTALLFNVFAEGFEVINADSVQVYRHLDIGSAKATAEERARIPHHLIDIRDPWEDFSVGDFIRLADEKVSEIESRGNVPVVCGGTAFYFKHFLYGLSSSPKSDPETRETVKALLLQKGPAWCHQYLESLDPVSAARIHPNDTYRTTRALEVCLSSGGKLSDFAVPDTIRNGMQVLSIGLTRPKQELDSRIRMRVDQMFDQGLENEIHALIALGATRDWPAMKAIGYQEFLDGNQDIEAVKHQIVMDSIHYAKRQKVFFQSFTDVKWHSPDDEDAIRSEVEQFLSASQNTAPGNDRSAQG